VPRERIWVGSCRFNSNSCLTCHVQPAAGGSSPAANPLIAIATLNGAKNMVPWFTPRGLLRAAEARREALPGVECNLQCPFPPKLRGAVRVAASPALAGLSDIVRSPFLTELSRRWGGDEPPRY
jgi:hypothetical protein